MNLKQEGNIISAVLIFLFMIFFLLLLTACQSKEIVYPTVNQEYCDSEAERFGVEGDYYCAFVDSKYSILFEKNDNNKEVWERFK